MNHTTTPHAFLIRPATDGDTPALRQLAHLDDRRLPRGELVIAQVGEEIRAAVSTRDGAVIADPWRPTAGIVHALRVWTGAAPVL